MKKVLLWIVLGSMLLSLVACGGGTAENTQENTTAAVAETTLPAETEPAYVYPEYDCKGGDFSVLNLINVWQMYSYIDVEAMTGEVIDDAVYERNRSMEERYNFKMKVTEVQIDTLSSTINSCAAAGDDLYDIAYARGNTVTSVVANGSAMNFYEVPHLQLDQPWWNQSVIAEASIGKNGEGLYFMLNDLSLCAFDLVWCIFFNENMMTDLGQEMPYNLVREGKWTLDNFRNILKLGANLNGDTSFDFSYDNKAIYGFTSFYRCCEAMLIGTENRYVKKDKDNTPALSLENDRFYTTAEKLATIFGTAGDYLEANQNGVKYDKIFMASRALFYGGEVKSSGVFRDMDDEFGILPLPKFDENQNNYYGWMNYDVPTMIIPICNREVEKTGILLDALSYASYTDVLPAYYEIRVCGKSLRNQDSQEMLALIRDNLYYDASLTYGWTATLSKALYKAIIAGNSSVASIIAENKDSVAASIVATISTLTTKS